VDIEITSQEGKTLKTLSESNPDEILKEVQTIFKNHPHIILSELTDELYVIYDGTEDMNVLGMVKAKTETPVQHEAIKVANEIEEQVRIVMPSGTDHDTILKVARYTADRMKSVIPMYTGNLNPKWKLYDTVFSILNDRLSEGDCV
jgi:hypothetical protein